MKIARRMASLLLIASVAFLLSTCSLASVSISDRISMFIQSLNGDRNDTYKNLDPNLPNPTAFDKTYWDTQIDPNSKPFSFTASNGTSNPSDVEGYITGNLGYNLKHKLIMVNVGSGVDDWRIHGLEYGNSSFTPYPGL